MEKIPVRSYPSRKMINIVTADDWKLDRIVGDHYQFVHNTKPGTVTIPHPVKNLPKKLVASILRQAGLK